ncbi:hypothetical protein FRC10_001659, partial [Ceratobasidium sp. 414]
MHTGAATLDPLQGHSGLVRSVAISSDGRRIVSGSDDDTLRIWDAHTGAAILDPLQGHSGSVTSVAISFDNRYIVSGSHEPTVRVWDMQSGAVFEPLLSPATSVAISSEGNRVLNSSGSSVFARNSPGGLDPQTFQQIFQDSPSSSICQDSRVMSLHLSVLCDQQGWIRGSSGEPLLWISPEYQRTRVDNSVLAISTDPEKHPVHFDLSTLEIGNG